MTSFLDTMIMHNEKAQMKIIENAQVKIKRALTSLAVGLPVHGMPVQYTIC